eukprot:gene7222-5075_t
MFRSQMASFISRAGAGLFHIAVRVKPGAKTSGVCAPLTLTDPAVELRVAAPPVEGKANAELVNFMEEELTQQLRALHTLKESYFDGTSYAALAAAAVEPTPSGGKGKKGHPAAGGAKQFQDVKEVSRVSVQLLRGSTGRSKVLEVAFDGSEALLVALLEKAAADTRVTVPVSGRLDGNTHPDVRRTAELIPMSSSMPYVHTDLVQKLRDAQDIVRAFDPAQVPGALDGNELDLSASPPAALLETYGAVVKLCRLWGTDVSYTHMIMANSFVQSSAARDADFALYAGENCLVTQIAAHNGPEAGKAAVLLQNWCDAIDINCGCPQKWAIQEGIGSALLDSPEKVADMVRCIRNAVEGGPALPCVVKMRVKDDLRCSVDFAQQCVAAGASWLTVHGRTPQCGSSAPVRWESIQTIREAVSVPVIVNGGVYDPSSALQAAVRCGAGGVMAGNGLLDNPASFFTAETGEGLLEDVTFTPGPFHPVLGFSADEPWPTQRRLEAPLIWPRRPRSGCMELWGLPLTPLEAVSDFVRLARDTDLATTAAVHHLLRMARPYLSPAERSYIALLRSNLSLFVAVEECGLYTTAGRFRAV